MFQSAVTRKRKTLYNVIEDCPQLHILVYNIYIVSRYGFPADPSSCGTFWPWTADLLVAENLRKCGSGIDVVATPRPLLPTNVEENGAVAPSTSNVG